MSIDICVVHSQKIDFHMPLKAVSFTDELERYFKSGVFDDCEGLNILLSLDPYDDTPILEADLRKVKILCENIMESYGDAGNYKMYDKLKLYNINREIFIEFATDMIILIDYALSNHERVFALGD